MLPAEEKLNKPAIKPEKDPELIYDIISGEGGATYDVHDLLNCIVDKDSMQEYKGEYGQTCTALR